MELENLVAQVFSDSQWEIGFSPESFLLSAPSQSEAFRLASLEPETLAMWAHKFGKVATLIQYPGGDSYRIPAAMAESEVTMGQETLVLDPQNPLIEIYALSLSPCLYQEIGWFLNNPTQPGGIVRVVDNQQVAMSYANAQKSADFTASAGVKKAVSWKRGDFWHPGDLNDFDRDWKQQLEPNNSNSWIEYKWRSFDPELGRDSEDGWIEFANRYKLLVDEFGNSYHVSWNLGMNDIAKPVGV
ncbi:hypothetical protein IQ268_28330 [Oculatella sp. LEGE 06141]|uniref:hypothetical protein n=1 Tax=Oculatella sp. LEGE 06141 TaxID=1828648 RepID=UPI00187E3FD5|nr:hypothetical protein [Oculatella sp. LEGE 06141]MBE9182461.1 hypothetical protein [Oculatella sp. LEGE 06141]